MTPEEKAEELIEKFHKLMYRPLGGGSMEYIGVAKYCARLCVEEILAALSVPPIENRGNILYDSQIDYWNKVLEILKAK